MIYGTPEFNVLLFDIISNKKRHDLYKESCEAYNKMKPHIYGSVPEDILNRNRPREPAEVSKYRIENYEPKTKSTASKAISVLLKIFNPWFNEVKWKNQKTNGKKLQDYALEYYPKYNSIIKFIAEAGTKRMIADANGVMAVRPGSIPKNDMEQAKPVVLLYGSSAIWWKDEDCYLIHLKEEQVKEGVWHYFAYYDKNTVIDFAALLVNSKDVAVREISTYVTDFNEIPVWELQGEIETTDEGLEYYISFFEAALPFWNSAITHESDVFAAYIGHMHPVKVEVVQDCDFIFDDYRCDQGKIKYGDGKINNCPGCNGTGKKSAAGPYGVHYVTQDKLTDGSGGGKMVPVQYATVPTEPTKMLEERTEKQHLLGLAALNMDIVDKVGENQSGVAKVIDRGPLFDFMYKIASVVYGTHLTNIFYFFNKYMFGVMDSNPGRKLDENLPEINVPSKFDISSTSEMTMEYSEASKAGINAEYLRQKMISIAAKEYANNPDIKRKVILTIELDPLPGMTVEQADILLGNGSISKRDAVIHFQISKFIQMALIEDESYYTLDQKAKTDKLIAFADKFIEENKEKLDTSLLDDTKADSGAN